MIDCKAVLAQRNDELIVLMTVQETASIFDKRRDSLIIHENDGVHKWLNGYTRCS